MVDLSTSVHRDFDAGFHFAWAVRKDARISLPDLSKESKVTRKEINITFEGPTHAPEHCTNTRTHNHRVQTRQQRARLPSARPGKRGGIEICWCVRCSVQCSS